MQSLAVSSDGTRLAVGGHDGSVRVIALAGITTEHAMVGDDQPVSALTFSPRGDRLLVGDQTGRVRIVDPHDGHVVVSAQAHDRYVNGVVWSADGRSIVSVADDPSVQILSPTDLTPLRIVRTASAPLSAMLASDGSHLLYHDGRSVLQLDLRLAMTDVEPATLLAQAEARGGVRLEGLVLGRRAP